MGRLSPFPGQLQGHRAKAVTPLLTPSQSLCKVRIQTQRMPFPLVMWSSPFSPYNRLENLPRACSSPFHISRGSQECQHRAQELEQENAEQTQK